jgi:hypothetical protein
LNFAVRTIELRLVKLISLKNTLKEMKKIELIATISRKLLILILIITIIILFFDISRLDR